MFVFILNPLQSVMFRLRASVQFVLVFAFCCCIVCDEGSFCASVEFCIELGMSGVPEPSGQTDSMNFLVLMCCL